MLNDVHTAYLQALVFTDLETEAWLEDFEGFSQELWDATLWDCTIFLQKIKHLDLSEWDAESLGHDFWLTRNGHGAGFWDRSRQNALQLTDIAEDFGECYFYVGDDGLGYVAGASVTEFLSTKELPQ